MNRLALLLAALSVSAAAYVAYTAEAWPHEATTVAGMPSGWSYSYACCSSADCRPVPASSVSEGPDGYVAPSGEVIPYGSTKLKDSRDQDFHWCTKGGKSDTPTLCLYVPPRSF